MNVRTLITALVVLALVGAVAPVASAQEATENSTETPETTYVGCIDERTCIVDYNYAGGVMNITIESTVYQEIALSDKFADVDTDGGFSSGGGSSKYLYIDSGRTEVSIGVTDYEGLASASIGTSQASGSVSEKTAAIVFHKSATWGDVQAATIFVAIGGLWLAFVVANYLTANRGPSAERVN